MSLARMVLLNYRQDRVTGHLMGLDDPDDLSVRTRRCESHQHKYLDMATVSANYQYQSSQLLLTARSES